MSQQSRLVNADQSINWRVYTKHLAFVKEFYHSLVKVVVTYQKPTLAIPITFNPLNLVLHTSMKPRTLGVWSTVTSSTSVLSQQTLHYIMDITSNSLIPFHSKYMKGDSEDVILESIDYTQKPGSIRFNFISGLSFETSVSNIKVGGVPVDTVVDELLSKTQLV